MGKRLWKNVPGKISLGKLLLENFSRKILLWNALRNYGRYQSNHMKYYNRLLEVLHSGLKDGHH